MNSAQIIADPSAKEPRQLFEAPLDDLVRRNHMSQRCNYTRAQLPHGTWGGCGELEATRMLPQTQFERIPL
jgi:hypothetical protein